MKKQYTMRLYRSHDIDLLMLERHGVNLVTAAKIALKSACDGDYYVMNIKPVKSAGYIELEPVYVRMIYLDTEENKKEIEFLKKVKNGGKNNVLKNLLRLYLFTPYNTRFFKSIEDARFMEDFFDRLKESLDVRDVPEIYRKTKIREKRKETDNPSNDIENVPVTEEDTKQIVEEDKQADPKPETRHTEIIDPDPIKEDNQQPEEPEEDPLDAFIGMIPSF